MNKVFENDPQDRKRRFLNGLIRLMGCRHLENVDIQIRDTISGSPLDFRDRLEKTYGLKFSEEELKTLIASGMTTRDFTEKYVEVIYQERGKVDLNSLVGNSITNGAIDLGKIEDSLKYGMNGGQWCDVAEGPCSCGAGHF